MGLAAVCVATAAFVAPEAYGIGIRGAIHGSSLAEMAIGLTIGAITFTGSIVAFAKLQGLVTGRPLVFPFQHPLNAALGLLLIALIVIFVLGESPIAFTLLVLLSLLFGFLLIVPIGGADMPVVISMLNSYSGWAACGIGFTLGNSLLDHYRRAGRLVGRDPQLCHVQGDEPLDLQRHPRRVRRRERRRRPAAAPAIGRSSRAAPRTPRSS